MRSVFAASLSERPLISRERGISFVEVVVGSFIVIGHNVLRILPNKVPILFVLFWISGWLRCREGVLSQFRRPKSWLRTILLAIAAAAVLLVGSQMEIQPLAHHFWPQPEQVSSLVEGQAHNWQLALRNLAIVWLFASDE